MLSLAGRPLRFCSFVIVTVFGIGLLLTHYRYIIDGKYSSISHGGTIHEDTHASAIASAVLEASDNQPPQTPPFRAVIAAGRDSTDLTWTDHLKAE